MSYDIKYRERVIAFMDEGNSWEKAQETFKVSSYSIKRWRDLLNKTGSLKDERVERKARKYDDEKLKKIIREKPDAYLSEIAEEFEKGTISGVQTALSRLKLTRKKKAIAYKERKEEERLVYQEEISQIPAETIIYVDEMGIDEYIHREYARSPRGEKVVGKISGKKYKRTNILAGKCGDKIIAPIEYDGKTDHKLFEWWFVTLLLPILNVGSVIVMDRASFHLRDILKSLAEEAGCRVIFLPAYSPDLNPIENYWACLKAKIRQIIANCESLSQAIHFAFKP